MVDALIPSSQRALLVQEMLPDVSCRKAAKAGACFNRRVNLTPRVAIALAHFLSFGAPMAVM